MKIGIESGTFFETDNIEKGIARIKNAGFDAIDYQGCVNTNNALFTGGISDSLAIIRKIVKNVSSSGLEISQVHGPWRWPPVDNTAEARSERFEKMSRSVEFCSELCCKYLVLHPIMPFGVSPDTNPEETWKLNLEFFGGLLQSAEKKGIIICIENMPMPEFSIASAEEVVRLVRTLDSNNVKCCLDTGHVTMFGSPADAVKVMGGDLLKVLHIHDNDGRSDLHWIPFQGVVDWEYFAKSLAEIDYNGVLSLETNFAFHLPEELEIIYDRTLAETVKYISKRVDYYKSEVI